MDTDPDPASQVISDTDPDTDPDPIRILMTKNWRKKYGLN